MDDEGLIRWLEARDAADEREDIHARFAGRAPYLAPILGGFYMVGGVLLLALGGALAALALAPADPDHRPGLVAASVFLVGLGWLGFTGGRDLRRDAVRHRIRLRELDDELERLEARDGQDARDAR